MEFERLESLRRDVTRGAEREKKYRDKWLAVIDFVENTLNQTAESEETNKSRDRFFYTLISGWMNTGDEKGIKTAEEKLEMKF